MDNWKVLAAMKRRRLGPERAAIVEAQTPPPPQYTLWNIKQQRAMEARAAIARRAEKQNQYVASLLAKVPRPPPPKIRREKRPTVEFSEWDDFDC
jgi:hypothetical protein